MSTESLDCNQNEKITESIIGDDSKGIRIVTIPRTEIGFGFNVRGQTEAGGQMRSINGELYGPLQEVSAIMAGGSAEMCGLKIGDKILEINGISVEGYMHTVVIDMLRSSVSPLVLTVITPRRVNSKINHNCKEVEQFHISIPEYQMAGPDSDSYVVFNIYINGRLACCRRYSHFDKLHGLLKSRFPHYNILPLPGKKFFNLSNQQLIERRRGLEKFLVSACSIEDIFKSDIMKQFLLMDDNSDDDFLVGLKILMPDHSLMEVKIDPGDPTEQVYNRVVNQLGLRTDVLPYFALFEVTPENFERKLSPKERPLEIVSRQENSDISSRIALKKWIFSPYKEVVICREPLVKSLIYSQAVESVKIGEIVLGERKLEAQNLSITGKQSEFLEIARQSEGYGRVYFPHCVCDSRKDGHVVCSAGYDSIQLAACTTSGRLEGNVLEFDWGMIQSFELQSTDAFVFTFLRKNKSPRTVTVFTRHSVYMLECFNRILKERKEDGIDGDDC